MLHTALFLAAEALLFTTALIVSWLVIRRAFGLLGVHLGRLARKAPIVLWTVVLAVNVACTEVYGPSFTTLYRLSGFALMGSVALLTFCFIVRRTRPPGAEPS